MNMKEKWDAHSFSGQMILRLKHELHAKLADKFKDDNKVFPEKQVNEMLFEAYKKGWQNCHDYEHQTRLEVIDDCIANLQDLKEASK